MMTYDEYRKAWDYAGQGNTPDVPIHVDIELSSVCNLQCPMCPQGSLPVSSKSFIDINLAKRIIDECQDIGVLSVRLNWRGESTLHPQFEEIAQYAKGKFVDVMLNTNGMYNLVKNIIIRECFTTVIFSFDSFYAPILKKIRPGADVDRIKFNIEQLRYSHVDLRINYTRQSANWEELRAIEKFCENRNIKLNTRIMYPRTDYEKEFVDKKVKVTGRKSCEYPFQRLTIAHDGWVYPCCIPWDGSCKVGNIKRESIKNLWNVYYMTLHRNDAIARNYSQPVCRDCTSWNSYVTEEVE